MSQFLWRSWRQIIANIFLEIVFCTYTSNGISRSKQTSFGASLPIITANFALIWSSYVPIDHLTHALLAIAQFSTLQILISIGSTSVHFAMPCQFTSCLTKAQKHRSLIFLSGPPMVYLSAPRRLESATHTWNGETSRSLIWKTPTFLSI
jgi:hypothetical protein